MKVVFINPPKLYYPEQNYNNLTLNKIYIVNYIDNLWYEITDDNGYKCWVNISDFVSLADYRNSQINSILND